VVRPFERFVGVDWSGAKDDRGAVYLAEVVGREAPGRLVVLRVERSSRARVEAELRRPTGRRTLVGLDFSFSFPAAFELAGRSDWSWEQLCAWCDHLVESTGGDVRAALHMAAERPQFRLVPGDRAELFWRATERACHPRPASVQDLVVYQRQVTLGTIHGMAMLHRLRDVEHLAVWPFDGDRVETAPVVVGEIYPSMWLDPDIRKGRAADRPRQVEAWRTFTEGIDGGVEELLARSGDALDALAVALALPSLRLEEPDDPLVAREGWILGVPLPE
jgi:hypothetical protein